MNGTCSACGAAVLWIISEQGRRIALNPDPSDGGTVIRVTVDGRILGRVLSGDELPAQEPAWTRHQQTCSESPVARARRARLTPRCRSCGGGMDPELAALEQWREHPCCDTDARAALTRYAANRPRQEAS